MRLHQAKNNPIRLAGALFICTVRAPAPGDSPSDAEKIVLVDERREVVADEVPLWSQRCEWIPARLELDLDVSVLAQPGQVTRKLHLCVRGHQDRYAVVAKLLDRLWPSVLLTDVKLYII